MAETKEQMVARIEAMARGMRVNLLEMTLHSGVHGAHIGGALSSTDILATLYSAVLQYRPSEPLWEERDRFILSKGHSSMALYAVLHRAGFLSHEELMSFEDNSGVFPAHCVQNDEKGIELSSGSLGLGLSFGLGCALALRKKQLASRVFVLLGNGECNEGSVWEAAMLAAQQKADHLVAIVDCNGLQLDGPSEQIIHIPNLNERFESFGWNVLCVDGHDTVGLLEAFEHLPQNGKPTVLLAATVKGKGVSFMEHIGEWHHASLSQEQYELAIREVQ